MVDVVVMGLSPTGLYAVREAAIAGYSVLGVGDSGAPGGWSRFLSESITAATPDARLDAILERFSNKHKFKPVLIVTSDQDLEAVITRADDLVKCVHIPSSYLNGLAAKIMDKKIFYEFCNDANISYPAVWSASVKMAETYRDRIAYPCMIKPSRIQDVKHLMSGRKGWILKNPSDFDRCLPNIPVEAGALIMQEIVPGPESNITLWCGYIDRSGKVRQRFTARKLRQYPPGFGSASLVQSEVCTETAYVAERLLCGLGYHGIAAAEFKRHPKTGELKIIEVNPRPSLWFSVTTTAGVHLVRTAVTEATGEAMQPATPQRNNIRWRYVAKDFASRLFYLCNRDFVLPAPDVNLSGPAVGRADVVGAWNDPMPVLGEIFSIVRKSVTRLSAKVGSNN